MMIPIEAAKTVHNGRKGSSRKTAAADDQFVSLFRSFVSGLASSSMQRQGGDVESGTGDPSLDRGGTGVRGDVRPRSESHLRQLVMGMPGVDEEVVQKCVLRFKAVINLP